MEHSSLPLSSNYLMVRHPPNCTKMLSIKNSVIHFANVICSIHVVSATFISRGRYPFDLVALIWVYLTLPSFFLKALCTRLLILDFNRLCGIVIRMSRWSSNDNKLVEFFEIHMLSTPLRLVLVLQYLINLSFMVCSSLVKRHNRSLFYTYWSHLLTNACMAIYATWESSTDMANFDLLQTFSIPLM